MLDVTDRHCRFFHRLLAPKALLYTEMVTTGALLYGDIPRHLQFNAEETPLALQLGGSDPKDLAHCARLGQQWGYGEINLNCGCPSERVQRGAFGACLMDEPSLVADCVAAMREAVDIPITVKHRIGLDNRTDDAFLHRFVQAVYQAGCRVFIVHARHAILKGLSPKDNRQIPPLRYEVLADLRKAFPDALFILNGGIAEVEQALSLLQEHQGIMVGRMAWHEPYRLRLLSKALWPDTPHLPLQAMVQALSDYAEQALSQGAPLRTVVKPWLGLMNGCQGAKAFRRQLSDPTALKANDTSIIHHAFMPFLTSSFLA